ncbi:hypothetical protein BD414DRAFT_531209 [Trametes punicea]|nr:hypothetical protein BD414DRAFT_531209 [Trametes punicea]
MDTPSTSAAALKLEIERLKGAISRHKSGEGAVRSAGPATNVARPPSNVYVNPSYKPLAKAVRPPVPAPSQPRPQPRPPVSVPQEKRDVVINGVAFESSGRSLVRKDSTPKPTESACLSPSPVFMTLVAKIAGLHSVGPASKPPSAAVKPVARAPAPHPTFVRNKAGTLLNTSRTYKPKVSRRGRPMNRNMTLNNTSRPYQSVLSHHLFPHTAFTIGFRSRRFSAKKAKYSDKPCPRFTSTGVCNRGLTCMYQHDPNKVAICWAFLQGNCPHSAETCPLSHDPTPERTPLCVHFANNGRCTRPNCPFPHVRVGPREGICRDFAVLGYCEKGLDCDKQHVRECPDFAEKGQCTTKGCKLPHVIRANRKRKVPPSSTAKPSASASAATSTSGQSFEAASSSAGSDFADGTHAEDGQLGDEFISLTFHESESEESDDESGEDEDADDEDEEEEMDNGEEGHELHSDNAATGDVVE